MAAISRLFFVDTTEGYAVLTAKNERITIGFLPSQISTHI